MKSQRIGIAAAFLMVANMGFANSLTIYVANAAGHGRPKAEARSPR